MPRPKKNARSRGTPEGAAQGVRPVWSGTITFGLVSIPVDLLSAVRSRQTAMKLIDTGGHALGRQYHCSKDGKKLDTDELVRGYEAGDGKMVVITDEEFESAAPEMSADIRLRNFVPIDQIPPLYFQRSYFLAPSGKSATAYNLLAATLKRTARAGIGSFVMRGHEYLVAMVSDNGVLRADTLRHADEIRSPDDIGLPARPKVDAKLVNQFIKEIEDLRRTELSMAELKDEDSEELQGLVNAKKKDKGNIVYRQDLETDEAEDSGQSAQIIDLTALLRRSLSRRAVVTTAERSEPISLDERRALKRKAIEKTGSRKKTGTGKSRKARR